MGRIEQIRAARQARYVRSKGDQLHCPYCLATLSFPAPLHLASEGARALSVLTKSRNWDTQYMAIAPLRKSGRRTSRMPLATSRRQAKQIHDFCQQGVSRNFRSQSTSVAKSRAPSALLGVLL